MKQWLACLLFAATFSAGAAPLGIMVPAYFYPAPGGLWNSLSNAATRVPLTAILNPDSGPGTGRDPNYVIAATTVRAAGGQVTGYIHTSHATRPLTNVEGEVDLYLAFYPLDGFFVDEMTDDAVTAHLDYYAALYQYIKAKNTNLSVTANPGTDTQEAYLTRPTADALVTFEDGTNYDTFLPDAWVTNYLARQFVHIPYSVAAGSVMSNYVALAVSRNAGWIYVTDDGGANPYDTLPSYWTNEVALVQWLNQSTPPTRLAVLGVTNRVPALQITGAPGTYEVQATSNLTSWFPAQILHTPTGTATLTDPAATNRPAGFYRTRQ